MYASAPTQPPGGYRTRPAAGEPQTLFPASALAGSGLGMFVGVLLSINYFGRPFELVLTGYRIPFVICAFALLVSLPYVLEVSRTRIGIAFWAFLCWLAVSIPFSTWIYGSLEFWRNYIIYCLVLMVVVAAAPRSFKHIRALVYTTAIAYLLRLAFLTQIDQNGRLQLKGTLGNSDDVAIAAGFLLPLWTAMTSQIRNQALRVLSTGVGAALLLRGLALCGTRTGIVAMATMVTVYFVRAEGLFRKLMILLGTALAFITIFVVLPDEVRDRYLTLFDSMDADAIKQQAMNSEAMASSAERLDLWSDALTMVREHPLFGVGPNQFSSFRYSNFRTDGGRPKHWIDPHNTFLQMGAESGIPALLLYTVFLVAVYRTILAGRTLNAPGSHPDWLIGRRMSLAFELSFVYFLACVPFMNCARHMHQFMLAGLALALERVSRARVAECNVASTAGTQSWPVAAPSVRGSADAAPRGANTSGRWRR